MIFLPSFIIFSQIDMCSHMITISIWLEAIESLTSIFLFLGLNHSHALSFTVTFSINYWWAYLFIRLQTLCFFFYSPLPARSARIFISTISIVLLLIHNSVFFIVNFFEILIDFLFISIIICLIFFQIVQIN